MARYSDIQRAQELNDALTKLRVWQDKTRAQKKADYKSVAKDAAQRSKAERMTGYILPFQLDSVDLFYEARILATTQTGVGNATATTLRSALNNRNKETVTGATNKTVRAPRGFDFAKVTLSERTQTVTAESPSRITGVPYKRHRYNNVTSPFGRLNAAESFKEAATAIKAIAALKTFAATAGNRVGITPES